MTAVEYMFKRASICYESWTGTAGSIARSQSLCKVCANAGCGVKLEKDICLSPQGSEKVVLVEGILAKPLK